MSAEAEPANLSMLKHEEGMEKLKENEGEQLVLGLGPVQRSFWRLSRLVPLDSVRKQFNKYRGLGVDSAEVSSSTDSVTMTLVDDEVVGPQSLEIQEGTDGISLKPFSDTDKGPPYVATSEKLAEQGNIKSGDNRSWRRVPYLPSYVPFGQVSLISSCFLSFVCLFHDALSLHSCMQRDGKVAEIIGYLMLMLGT